MSGGTVGPFTMLHSKLAIPIRISLWLEYAQSANKHLNFKSIASLILNVETTNQNLSHFIMLAIHEKADTKKC